MKPRASISDQEQREILDKAEEVHAFLRRHKGALLFSQALRMIKQDTPSPYGQHGRSSGKASDLTR